MTNFTYLAAGAPPCGVQCPAPGAPVCRRCEAGECGATGALPPLGGPAHYRFRVAYPGGGVMVGGLSGRARDTTWAEVAELLLQTSRRRPAEIQVAKIPGPEHRR